MSSQDDIDSHLSAMMAMLNANPLTSNMAALEGTFNFRQAPNNDVFPDRLRTTQELAELYHLDYEPDIEGENKVLFCNIPQFDPTKEEPLDNQFIRLGEALATTPDVNAFRAPAQEINLMYQERQQRTAQQRRQIEQEQIRLNEMLNQRQAARYPLGTYPTYYASFLQFDFLEKFDEVKLSLLAELLKHNDAKDAVKNIKATKLLKECLTRKEWQELMKDHQVTIKSKKHHGRKYIVPEDPERRVQVKSRFGRSDMQLCGVVQGTFPAADKLATKIMAIKADEDSYIASSNVS